jgi:hypothetical protein
MMLGHAWGRLLAECSFRKLFTPRRIPMNRLARPTALKIAAVLSLLLSAISIINALPLIAQGATAIDTAGGAPPYPVLVLALLMGVVGIVAAYGTWKQQRWGIILTIIVNVVNGLSAAPGLFFAPQPAFFVSALVTGIASIIIVVLCLWRERRPATV